jgi:hypothetical protein
MITKLKTQQWRYIMKQKIIMTLLASAGLASVTAVQGALVTGSIWENVNTVAPTIDLNGTLANAATLIGGRAADVTFNVNSPITFSSIVGGYTIGGFLGSGGAIITGGADATPAGNTLNNTFFYFTGQVTVQNGQSFNVTHDDGLQLQIGNTLVVDVPGPTAPITTPYTWTGASGTYNFELAYAENSGAPGVLDIQLPLAAVPEPGTVAAGAMLLLPLGLSAVRRFRNRAA